ncbi:putative drug exporter of the RND superfamily [Micromonospora pattaloongensis]|uniref:Putative drug exporter of the RND superfamily n=1 Tax=Micromonospora pattaloongensis TaxID=405436 RepID=A0A1H3RHQ1_9ACTN|nr:MMPL family transporter [Micromonospora pattaloongensis]SDZ24469.1 putative drug exporter of the RND superfamily [Micromonospora pattaloongensis]
MAGGTRRALLTAIAVVLGWLVVGGVVGPYAGKLGEVATNDNTSFLPADAEATRAQELATGFTSRPTTPALVIYERGSGITDADRQRAAGDAAEFARVPGVVGPVSPPIPSEDGRALQVIVPLDESLRDGLGPSVDRLRAITGRDSPGLAVHVTGPAGFLADLVEVFKSIDVTLLLVTATVVLVILLVVYRSPVLWIIPMLAAGISYALAAFAVYLLADADVIVLNGQAQGILTVLVFGAGTDYALLLIARYREELRRHDRTVDALKAAWRGAAPAIIASAGTVIASLLCLLLSSLNSNRALGPVSAVGIVATLLVMLTLLPALLLIGGRWVFWPRIPRTDPAAAERPGGLWRRVADLVARRARPVWIATTLALAACALGLTQLGSTALGQSDVFTTRPDSVAGQEALVRHYPGGAGSPATIITAASTAETVTAAARAVPGVVRVAPLTEGQPATGGPPTGPPRVVDGRVQLLATLAAPGDTAEAEQTVRQLREAVHAVPGAGALVAGATATSVDVMDASTRDRNVIIPVILVVIALILALLLRSLLAPVLLIATVVLSFAATLGLCALLFRHVFGYPGVDASFPLFAFVFLVALGIDYNIFLMTRVREESLCRGTRDGVRYGLIATGGVITSAGVVLAATFSALAVLPLIVLVELGVAVALGVLLDTVIVRSLLVPALVHDLGRIIWWPSRLPREPADR